MYSGTWQHHSRGACGVRAFASNAAIALALTGAILSPPAAVAKSPGATHCFNNVCHRVLTLKETAAQVGRIATVNASHYGAPGNDAYNPRAETSSGAIFDPKRDDTIASPIYPDGTRILLWNPVTGHAASVRVTNAGPYMGGRTIDASQQLARRLGFFDQGTARLHAIVIAAPTAQEATYHKGRIYPKAPGYIGRFPNAELALLGEIHGGEVILASTARPKPVTSASDAATSIVSHRAAPVAGFRQEEPKRPPVVARAVLQPPKPKFGVERAPAAQPSLPKPAEPRTSTTRCVFDNGPGCG